MHYGPEAARSGYKRSMRRHRWLFAVATWGVATAWSCKPTTVPAPNVPKETVPATPLAPSVMPSPPRLWGELTPGEWAVGFHQEVLLDPARSYDPPFAHGERGRPLVVETWYPAQVGSGAEMTVGRYLEVPASDSITAGLRERLQRYTDETFAREVFGQERAYLEDDERRSVEELRREPVFARVGAERVASSRGLILAHAGLGGVASDNFVLYEYLASRGYVVISSSFLSADAGYLTIAWEPETSIGDLDLLLRHARSEAPGEPLAVVGHSWGAQAALIYAMVNPEVDAVVSIDSTIENGRWFEQGDARYWFGQIEGSFYEPRRLRLRMPALLLSGPEPVADFYDGMVHSERALLEVPTLEHDQFVSHGGALAPLRVQLSDGASEEERAAADEVRTAYEFTVVRIGDFLDARLAGDAEAGRRMAADPQSALPGAKLRTHPAARPQGKERLVELALTEGVEAARARCDPSSKPCRAAFEAGAVLTAAGRPALGVPLLRAGLEGDGQWFLWERAAGWAANAGDLEAARAFLDHAAGLVAEDGALPEEARKELARDFRSRLSE